MSPALSTVDPLLVATSAHAEERMRFNYLALAVAGSAVLMGCGYAALGNWGIALTGFVLAAVTLGLRAWGLRDVSSGRLQNTVQLTTAAILMFQLWQVLGLKESVAGWYMCLLPLGIAVFCGLRATLAWVAITTVAIVFVAWAEPRLGVPEHSAAPITVVARCVMMMVIVLFGIATRRTRDHHIAALTASFAALRKAQKDAEEANQAKSAFLATMSHELRTPLNAVIGLNSLMLESILPPMQRQQAELACQAGETMLQLINEILDFSRIESGRLELDNQVFSPRHLLEECVGMMAQRAVAKRLHLRSEIEVPLQLFGDATRLRQVLLNLLSNAIKFTPHGEVRLRACEHSWQSRSWLYVEVHDTGIGIPVGAESRIFHPFEQADASTTRLFGGTGLGLAICKGLVAAMGGKIGVNSTPGSGSTFWVELPFTTPTREQEKVASAMGAAPAAARRETGTARILLAEDNTTNQFVARQMLKKLGYEVDIVNNGVEAVDAARRERYDLIFMDCHMPVLDGFAACRTIRAGEPDGQRVPIVAMTALAFKSDQVRCVDAGMDDYLSKPVRLHELSRVIGRWMRSGQDLDLAL
jgi:signal transduction histidine kinase/ActR/RegA family two-component response regulator